MLVLVTGGARSGKSTFAEAYAARLAGQAGCVPHYLATSVPFDSEMKERVERHRWRRANSGTGWETVEGPYDVAGWLNRRAAAGEAGAVLLDCLTLWLSNWLLRWEGDGRGETERKLEAKTDELVRAFAAFPGHLVAVTNEVGAGIVPETPPGRLFRDAAGILNQRIAAVCDEVYLVACGLPIELKRRAVRW